MQITLISFDRFITFHNLVLSGASPPESPSITETSINYIQLDLDNAGKFRYVFEKAGNFGFLFHKY